MRRPIYLLIMLCFVFSVAALLTGVPVRSQGNPPVDPGAGWKLIFSDAFDGTALDTSKWNTCYRWAEGDGGCTSAGNGELEWYQPDDVIVNHGLILRAEQRRVNDFQYTSGMITSLDRFAFLYGYMEARMKIPVGKGLWPAFWALPVQETWPPEIDVMEVLGDQPAGVHMTVFWPTTPTTHDKDTSHWDGPDFSADFHNFGVDWEPDAITWYVDGVPRKRFTDPARIPAIPMFLIANLAVGGTWPGAPDSRTKFPSDLQIQYIKVWQRNAVPRAGSGVVLPTASGSGANGTHSGKQAIRAVILGAPTYSNLYQVAAVAAHTDYGGAIWIKGAGSLTLYIKNDAWENDTLASTRCTATASWQVCALPTFNTGSNTRVTFVLQDDDGAPDAQALYLDDAYLGWKGGINRLADPGFEKPNSPWSINRDAGVFSLVANP